MNDRIQNHRFPNKSNNRAQKVKVVAEMPSDGEMRDQLQERKENDGHPGSCGI